MQPIFFKDRVQTGEAFIEKRRPIFYVLRMRNVGFPPAKRTVPDGETYVSRTGNIKMKMVFAGKYRDVSDIKNSDTPRIPLLNLFLNAAAGCRAAYSFWSEMSRAMRVLLCAPLVSRYTCL